MKDVISEIIKRFMVLVMLAIKKRENEERGNENSVRKKEHFIKY